jgi:hypothetical protein
MPLCCRRAGGLLSLGQLSALALLLLLPAAALAATPQRFDRGGYISTTLTPLFQESPLQGTSYMPILDEIFESRIADFGTSLVEGLEKTTFNGRLILLPDFRPERHARFRAEGQQDTFLLSIDLRTDYGLSDSSPLAAMATGASCFLLSRADLFRYRAHTEAFVNVHYFTPAGKTLRILHKNYHVQQSVKGDFLQAMSMAQEVDWISQLTAATLEKVKRALLSDLPRELPQRAWRKAANYLTTSPRAVPSVQFAQSRIDETPPQGGAGETPPPDDRPSGAGGAFDLARLARQVSPSVCKIRAKGRTGSGFVLSRKGYVLTSLLVVEGAEQISVRFHGARDIPARLFLVDKSLDLAVLSLADGFFDALPLGNGPPPPPATQVTSFGFPQETGLHIAAAEVLGVERLQGRPLMRIAAALPEGTRGGPLVDERGRCIGVTIRTYADHALSVPASEIRRAFSHVLDPE